MKAPFWGKCGVVVGVSAIGIAMVLYTTGRLRAADPAGITMGPAIAPLGRAGGGPVDFDYNAAAAAAAALQNNGGTPASAAPGSNVPGVSATMPNSVATANGLHQPSANAPATLPSATAPFVLRPIDPSTLPLTGDPISGAPSNGSMPANQTASVATSINKPAQSNTASPEPKVTSWRSIQTAFKQYVEPRTDSSVQVPNSGSYTNRPYANSPSMEQRLYGAPLQPGQAGSSYGQNTSTAQSDSPNTVQAPTVPVDPPVAGEVLDGPYHPVRPGNAGSQCASCARGNGCGPLPPGAADCPNCGGWKPGSCQPCDPNGSCILERLGCLLNKPYPDISNGCLDFCHSWIWHEDDFWLFSNHKCVPPGCGPYPYGGCPNDGMGKGINCGCGNCGFCVAPPDLYFSGDAMALTRQDTGSFHVLGSGTATMLTTNDFNFDWRVGPAITLGYRPTPKDAWEITYFGLQDWNETESLTGGGISLGGTSPNNILGTLGNFANANALNVNYSSTIENGEINYLWHPYPGSGYLWLFGFRYFQLNEELDMLSTKTGIGTADYDIHTVNDLVGLQLGVRLQHRFGDRFCMDGTVKGGVYRSHSEQRQFAESTDSAGPVVTEFRNTDTIDDHWAYVAEAGFNANYFLCKNWSVTAGYNVLWVGQVALAPDQINYGNTPDVSGTMLNHGGSVFMHGAHLGLSCRW